MSDFLSLPDSEQIFLCRHIGEQLGITPSIVEKDFLVCRVLQILFGEESLSPYLCFRGGTSLSKAYKVIRRFSEDLDMLCRQDSFLICTRMICQTIFNPPVKERQN